MCAGADWSIIHTKKNKQLIQGRFAESMLRKNRQCLTLAFLQALLSGGSDCGAFMRSGCEYVKSWTGWLGRPDGFPPPAVALPASVALGFKGPGELLAAGGKFCERLPALWVAHDADIKRLEARTRAGGGRVSRGLGRGCNVAVASGERRWLAFAVPATILLIARMCFNGSE